MHQIRFRLGLRPRHRAPQTTSWILGGPTSKGGERAEEGRGKEGKGREGRGREGGEVKGRTGKEGR